MCRIGLVKLTGPLERVLRVLVADPAMPHYGYDLMKAAKLPSGTLYQMLARLQQEGLVDSEWEDPRPDAGGRPPRKYYQLTRAGHAALAAQKAEWTSFVASVARVLADNPTSSARTAGGAR